MIVNDLKKKVVGRFYKEITIDGYEGEEFISVLKRKFVNQRLVSKEKV